MEIGSIDFVVYLYTQHTVSLRGSQSGSLELEKQSEAKTLS